MNTMIFAHRRSVIAWQLRQRPRGSDLTDGNASLNSCISQLADARRTFLVPRHVLGRTSRFGRALASVFQPRRTVSCVRGK